jgi:hypothetical protein
MDPGEQLESSPPPEAAARVSAPAIGLIAAGAINVLLALWGFVEALLVGQIKPELPPNLANNEVARKMVDFAFQYGPTISIIHSTSSLICGVLVVLGGISFLRLRSFGMSVTGAILAAVPCVTHLGCCGLGQAIGIWALVVMMSPSVRPAFP